MIEHDLDVYFFAESWLKDSDNWEIGELEDSGKFKYLSVPRVGRTGGGVACLAKANLDLRKVEIPEFKTFECMETGLCIKNRKITLVTIYRPESSWKKKYKMSEFFDEFTDFLADHHRRNSEVVIMGDFNFHVNKNDDTHAKKLLDILKMFDMKQHITEPTHKNGNTLDLLITPKDSVLTQHKVDDLNSDHNNILFQLSVEKPMKLTKKIRFRRWKNIDLTKFRCALTNRFEGLIDTNDHNKTSSYLNDLVSTYESTKGILDKHAPEIEKVVILRDPTPWVTADIKKGKIEKRKAERKWRKSRNIGDWEEYKLKKNAYNVLLNDLRAQDISNKINKNKDNPRNMFKALNKALHRKQESVLPPHSSEKSLADEFSTFFDDKIRKIREKLDNADHNCNQKSKEERTYIGEPFKTFRQLSQDEVKKILQNMPNKQCKLDPIPFWLVKDCIDQFLPLITEIINTSLKLGEMPEVLKHAQIKPLLKKLNLELLYKNYRPVSNLQFLGKAIESAVITQYLEHLSKQKLQDNKQSAYKKFHSTETLLMKVHNDIMSSMSEGEIVILILLDLSAAFDTIDHDILLKRLENTYGIEGTALRWFKSYISNRTQSVIINNIESDRKELKFGVPQGSKLGPILFNSYIAPISKIAIKHNVTDEKYADDQQLLLAFKPKQNKTQLDAKQKIQECIQDIRKFLHSNKLSNNSDKTEFLLIGSQAQLNNVKFNSIDIDDVKIETVSNAKNLGVILDNQMKMDKQVNNMCKKTYFNIRNISKIRKCLSKEDTKTVVNALVTPHLDYGNGLLVGTSKYLIDKLQVAQNSAVRLIERVPKYEHIAIFRQKLHWLPILSRIQYKILLMTWKALNKQAPHYLQELLKLKKSHRNLRNANTKRLEVPECATANSFGERAFSISAPMLWNKIPEYLRTSKTVAHFKKGLKTHLFTKPRD